MFMRFLSIVTLLFAVLLAMGCGPSTETEPEPTPTPTPDALLSALAAYAPPTLAYEKLGADLNRMISEEVREQAKESQDGQSNDKHPSSKLVRVDIAISGNAEQIVTFLQDNSVEPSYVGYDVITAIVPLSLLPALSQKDEVVFVRKVAEPSFGQRGEKR